jgi:hypothetical protein
VYLGLDNSLHCENDKDNNISTEVVDNTEDRESDCSSSDIFDNGDMPSNKMNQEKFDTTYGDIITKAIEVYM